MTFGNLLKYFDSFINYLKYRKKVYISGEVNVMAKDVRKSIFNNDELHDKIFKKINFFNSLYPSLEIEMSKDIYETSIKLFSYGKCLSNNDYFESLNRDISNLVDNLHDLDALRIKINIKGKFLDWENVNEFLITGTDENIYYKITNKKQLGFTFRTLGMLIGKFTNRI